MKLSDVLPLFWFVQSDTALTLRWLTASVTESVQANGGAGW